MCDSASLNTSLEYVYLYKLSSLHKYCTATHERFSQGIGNNKKPNKEHLPVATSLVHARTVWTIISRFFTDNNRPTNNQRTLRHGRHQNKDSPARWIQTNISHVQRTGCVVETKLRANTKQTSTENIYYKTDLLGKQECKK